MSEEVKAEVEALEAIFPELIKRHVEDGSVLWLIIPERKDISLQISLGGGYPSKAGPSLVDIRGADKDCREGLKKLLQECWEGTGGEVCLYEFMVESKNVLAEQGQEQEQKAGHIDEEKKNYIAIVDPFKFWKISEPIRDRGSTFIGYATSTEIEEEALGRLECLKHDPRIRRGQHVMCAWRLKRYIGGREMVFQDSDDDGESGSGGRMLKLMVAMGMWNSMVVVVRWFNGTHIGPDRFRHINCAAREALLQL